MFFDVYNKSTRYVNTGGEKMRDKKIIGERLKNLRGDIPRLSICEDVGISESALAMYETGQRIPRDEIKVALARRYNTTVGALFFD